ncbi:MAG: 4-hydroxythreonine-4-phosphate dehydrogenase PdxA [Cyclobacteriaceae bacterium]
MNDSTHSTTNKPIIGISVGDYNGIGPEVIIKAIEDNRLLRYMIPVLYCDSRVMSFYRKQLDLKNFNYNQVKTVDQIHHKRFNLVNIQEEGEIKITPGEGNSKSGKYALKSLRAALDDLKANKIDALCTAPLSKELIQSDDFKFPGHTEFLTKESEQKESLMLLIDDNLRVGVVTGHIPIKEVSESLTKEKIKMKLQILRKSLKKDFGKSKPKIAVLGLNPHAGENGLLGKEEEEIIAPVISEMKKDGHLIFGPFPADGFFGSSQFKNFDGILAMYHDQGLIPFKNIAFESGVNFTAGLTFVRTSPDHGTAFGVAGKGTADPTSMRNALLAARDILKSRTEMGS